VRVAVLGTLGGATSAAIPDLLTRCGLGVASSPHDADLVLVTSLGEVDRDLVDPLVRRRTSHLVARLVDGGAVVGPFVVPGLTACLRCIDAHRCVADPHHVSVTTRYVRATSRARPDGVEDVADPALAAAVVGWAVRDLAAHVTGREPSTWSRTLSWGPDPTDRREEAWRRHPECGCSWAPDSYAPWQQSTGGSSG
jgi:hypothetical protein